MKSFEHRRRALNRQMLPHTLVGHPAAAVLSAVGLLAMADAIHYRTLPRRARRRLAPESVTFSHNRRLFWADLIWTPLCSMARAVGWHRVAETLFLIGPWKTSLALGGCGYMPAPSRAEMAEDAERAERQRREEAAAERAFRRHGARITLGCGCVHVIFRRSTQVPRTGLGSGQRPRQGHEARWPTCQGWTSITKVETPDAH